MGFIFEAILELIWILVSHTINLILLIAVEICKLIPIWIWIIIAVIAIICITKKLFFKSN